MFLSQPDHVDGVADQSPRQIFPDAHCLGFSSDSLQQDISLPRGHLWREILRHGPASEVVRREPSDPQVSALKYRLLLDSRTCRRTPSPLADICNLVQALPRNLLSTVQASLKVELAAGDLLQSNRTGIAFFLAELLNGESDPSP